MEAIIEGNSSGPLLVCCHGLLGGPEDFAAFRKEWGKHCKLILLDMDQEARKHGFKDNSGAFARLCYDKRADEVASLLKENFPGQKAYFVGISIGGKVVYEMAGKFPELFLSGVVTDQGVGSMVESDLCKFIEETVPSINLNQSWRELKNEVKQKVPDHKLQVLILTQVSQPKDNSPAQWKPELESTRNMLSDSTIEKQWNLVPKMKAPITVIKATYMSSISDKDFERMKSSSIFNFQVVQEATHFLHISHPDKVESAVLKMLEKQSTSKLNLRERSTQGP